MADRIKRALTRRHMRRGRQIVEEPTEKMVIAFKFALGMTAFMSTLELAHIIFLNTWNAEIFATITGLSGTIIGLFAGQKT